ncbi:MAG: spore cortex-lytic enzyme [Clostridia bacterium]|nr:spore cortex-lytic enzyme [Clostridia bacterium]
MEFNKRKICFLLAIILLICFLLAPHTLAKVYKVGSRGSEVKTIQTKLKRWGYYNGTVDGIFGTKTKQAVISFQRKNGLTADGIVGSATLRALGMASSSSSSSSSNNSNLYLLAQLVHGEARGEPYKGQVAVASVVLNRVKSSSFPNSIPGVIYQSGAFSVVDDGQINLTPNETAIKAAKDAMNGWDPTNGCLYYYNPRKTTNKWMLSKPVKLVIGSHSFF